MSNKDVWDNVDEVLAKLGMARTRENWLWVLYNGDVPDEFDHDDEMVLPPDLRAPGVNDEPDTSA